ncbi:hypothetical protein OHA37_39490 [Streptomyces sp. NBC_00335]|uniref:hypothetical protein n=1 Tax=unclassified Streptomyces TaxID=2593676 RepID=UPI002258A850|nr:MULTISPECIES: hypothetical protein [unclassified Streptomyces]MCX5409911.1 hypothetical protein [Streptomyces sp. NBC_00086]
MDHPARRYYNPEITATEERDLLRRNYLLIQTLQASLGLIGPDVLAIAVEPRPEEVVLHFAVAELTAEVEEDVEDIVFELTVFLAGGPEQRSKITTELHVGDPHATWHSRRYAMLYRTKIKTEAE